MTYYIYKHTSPSNKSYIGITNDLGARARNHRSTNNQCRLFAAAIKKYGWDAFTHTILATVVTEAEAKDAEVTYIAQYETFGPKGYNLGPGGDYREFSEETRKLMSEARKGVPKTEEHKRKIAEALKGKARSGDVVERRMKEYVVTSPSGDIYNVKGLAPFCREHGLDQPQMNKVAAGKAKQHKGWLCRYATPDVHHEQA